MLLISKLEQKLNDLKKNTRFHLELEKKRDYFCTTQNERVAQRNIEKQAKTRQLKFLKKKIWQKGKSYYLCSPKQKGREEVIKINGTNLSQSNLEIVRLKVLKIKTIFLQKRFGQVIKNNYLCTRKTREARQKLRECKRKKRDH